MMTPSSSSKPKPNLVRKPKTQSKEQKAVHFMKAAGADSNGDKPSLEMQVVTLRIRKSLLERIDRIIGQKAADELVPVNRNTFINQLLLDAVKKLENE